MLKFAFSVCVGTWCAPSSVLVTTDCGPVLSSPRHLSNWAVTAPPLTATTHNLGRRQLVNIFHFIINNSSSPTLGHLPLVPHCCVKEESRFEMAVQVVVAPPLTWYQHQHMSAQTDQPPLVAISALKAADCLHNEWASDLIISPSSHSTQGGAFDVELN